MTAYELPTTLVGRAPGPQTGTRAVDQQSRAILETMWDDVAPVLARLAAVMGVPGHAIEDLVQEIFMTAWQKGPTGTDRQQLKWWLIRVTTNRCNLLHRRRVRWRRMWQQVARLRSVLAAGEGRQDTAVAGEERELVAEAIENLPPLQRTVLVLRYFEDYDSKQIGQILEMPDSTVRSHLRKARNALAVTLTEAGYVHDA